LDDERRRADSPEEELVSFYWRFNVMKKGSFRRSVAVSILGILCAVLNTGCSWADVQFGFSAGLGAIPANIIGSFITAQFLAPAP